MERVPEPVGDLPAPEVVALLSPFVRTTTHATANNMLFLYIKYHMVLGIKRYVQYTQVQHALTYLWTLKCVVHWSKFACCVALVYLVCCPCALLVMGDQKRTEGVGALQLV